jgi:hypothetical protein
MAHVSVYRVNVCGAIENTFAICHQARGLWKQIRYTGRHHALMCCQDTVDSLQSWAWGAIDACESKFAAKKDAILAGQRSAMEALTEAEDLMMQVKLSECVCACISEYVQMCIEIDSHAPPDDSTDEADKGFTIVMHKSLATVANMAAELRDTTQPLGSNAFRIFESTAVGLRQTWELYPAVKQSMQPVKGFERNLQTMQSRLNTAWNALDAADRNAATSKLYRDGRDCVGVCGRWIFQQKLDVLQMTAASPPGANSSITAAWVKLKACVKGLDRLHPDVSKLTTIENLASNFSDFNF